MSVQRLKSARNAQVLMPAWRLKTRTSRPALMLVQRLKIVSKRARVKEISMAKIKEGLRVRLAFGDLINLNEERRYPYAEWCGGKIPVGTLGTIHRACVVCVHGNCQCEKPKGFGFMIVWDGYEPKPGWYFGISGDAGETLYEMFEAVEETACFNSRLKCSW